MSQFLTLKFPNGTQLLASLPHFKRKKGLLALEGELAPILVQMVKSANTNGLLDNESDELHEFAGE